MSTPDTAPSPETTEMTTHEIWHRLRRERLGRVAVIVQGRPEIFPVNHVVDHGTLVFRTTLGTKLRAMLAGPVCFEADGYDLATGQAWSVMVKGHATEVTRLYDVLDAARLPLAPWQAGNKPRVVRIEADEVSGRSFRAVQYRL